MVDRLETDGLLTTAPAAGNLPRQRPLHSLAKKIASMLRPSRFEQELRIVCAPLLGTDRTGDRTEVYTTAVLGQHVRQNEACATEIME